MLCLDLPDFIGIDRLPEAIENRLAGKTVPLLASLGILSKVNRRYGYCLNRKRVTC